MTADSVAVSPKRRYAKFWKADLQLQTPVDRGHWRGQIARLGNDPTDSEITASATAYAERCYEVGLEIWGITDHNLGGELAESFLDALAKAIDALAPKYGWRPAVFPGFEVEANVGKGLHLLCLFDPATPFDDVDDVLTDLGLPRKDRFRGGRPSPLPKTLDEVLDCVQNRHGGLVIAAHPDSTKGAMSDQDLAKWLSVSVITNQRLLCMELRRGREAYADAPGTIGAVVRNDPGEWHRRHPIAVVTNSDCKRLTPDDGTGEESWIGKRFSWLKMSERSIEGLRQAFLDHESRIRHGVLRPEDLEHYPRIASLRVSGVSFLANQAIALSPNLSAIIGGGGTGKSTLIEYTRAAVHQDMSAGADDVRANHERIMKSLGGGTVSIVLRQGESEIVATMDASGVKAYDSSGADVKDLAARFPVMVLGQREVYAVADNAVATRGFLDRLQEDRIRELNHKEELLRNEVCELGEALDQKVSLEARLIELSEEKARYESALEALHARQEPLKYLDSIRREESAIGRLEEELTNRAQSIRETAAAVERELPSLTLDPPTPSADALTDYSMRAEALAKRVVETLRDKADSIDAFLDKERSAKWRSDWKSTLERAQSDYEALAPGTEGEPASAAELRTKIDERENDLARLATRISQLTEEAADRPNRLNELKEVWAAQVAARREIAASLRSLVPATATGEPYVEVSVDPYGDRTILIEALYERISDNRAFNREDASELVGALYGARESEEEPTSLLCSWLRKIQDGGEVEELASITPARREALRRTFTESEIRKLEVLRPPDLVRVLLRREDGSLAGSLEEGLSVGQRCTAILALALSTGDFPILIDQPEDEIANEFIYRELVPLLRRAKQKRQVIISTHDPNLPVNGDAELIYALEARSMNGGDVRGRPKEVDGGPAIGSLDRARVKRAVEEIMEGSEEAFRRRYERYGF